MPSLDLAYEKLQEGAEIEPLVKGPITKEQLKEYGPAAGDPNPIHLDDEFAKMAGYPGVFAHGMLSMGFLGQFLVDRFGLENIKKFKVRFAKITWPGEVITCMGKVIGKRVEDGEKLVDLELATQNEKGEKKILGEATVRVA
jgi:acyl dehydratase